jgi:hypothetical protein
MKKCPECGSKNIRRSRTQNFGERLKKLSAQRAYRCRDCRWRGMLPTESSRFSLVMKDKILAATAFLILAAVVLFLIFAVLFAHRLMDNAAQANNPAAVQTSVAAPAAPAAPAETPPPAVVSDPPPPAVAPEEAIRSLMKTWLESWKTGDMKTYRSCYAPDFESRGRNLDEWVAQKTRLIRKNRKIDIRVEQIQITARGSDAKVMFIQYYSSSHSRNSGKKKTLELKKTDGEWKIYREIM